MRYTASSMPIRKDLPPRYYLDHFRDMINAIRKNQASFLDDNHLAFITDFEALPLDAQCLYVRFVNRKGKYFFREQLRYAEIIDMDGAMAILKEKNFLRIPMQEDLSGIFEGLAKEKLIDYCEHYGVPVKKSWPKPRFLEELSQVDLSVFPMEKMATCVVQDRLDELSYLLFLYFGEISENLSLYTLRDLGIWSENKRTEFVPKFHSRDEARTQYFYSRLIDEIDPEIYDHALIESWPQPSTEEGLALRDSLLVAIGETLRKNEKETEALSVLEKCVLHPGRERRVRLLYHLGDNERVLKELETICESPTTDEELLFAEDFLERKFHKKKRTSLTQILVDAETLPLDEAWFRQPEEGVKEVLTSRGKIVHHAENGLWRALFGVLFWHEIFESPLNTFHSQFERLPEELGSSRFYLKHLEALKEKLTLLREPEQFLSYWERMESEKSADKNGIFSWAPDIKLAVMDLVKFAPISAIEEVLLHMAQDFHRRARGYPDLMIIEDGKVRFAEIKAPGDSLRGHQFMQMNVLKRAGFPVELLKVEYRLSSEQVYVVVDLETTGGMMPYHRITEIGAVKIKNNEVIGTYQTLVNPKRRISEEIQKLTGITNEMVQDAPVFEEVAEAFQEFSKGCIFVAHNVNFDYGFLQAEYGRLEERFVRPFLCTKVLSRKHFPDLPSYSLANLTAHFEIPLVSHHRAMCDAEATAKLFVIINGKRA